MEGEECRAEGRGMQCEQEAMEEERGTWSILTAPNQVPVASAEPVDVCG